MNQSLCRSKLIDLRLQLALLFSSRLAPPNSAFLFSMTQRGCAKSKAHLPRFQTAGWSAFVRQHEEKPSIGAEDAVDPCQLISKKPSSGMMESSNCFESGKHLLPIQSTSARSFSSVVRPSTFDEFPLLKAHTKIEVSNINIDEDQHAFTLESNVNPVVMLKDVHSWADQYLIEDILAAVNNDIGQASILLRDMVSFETGVKNVHSGPSRMSLSAPVSYWNKDKEVFLGKNSSVVNKDISENSHEELIIKQFNMPTEPEWEEDDVYLSHRKEALKGMRAASQHSRSAYNAYMRGDHLTARELSSRAREERMTAEKLNVQAAEEILRIRNSDNDIWKLDLHGLHAPEAVHALTRHLERLEFKMMMGQFSSTEELAKLEKVQRSPPFDSSAGFEFTGYSKGTVVPRARQTLLHVITGTGNHSKGEAALPAAVKRFLIDEGYRFDDARPGVISVRPKFRFE